MASLYTFPPQKVSKLSIPDDEPIYRVVGNGFFDGETLHEEYDAQGRPTLIAYPDEPNYNLLPMNELALMAVEDWMKKLARGVEEAKENKEYGMRMGVQTHEINMRSYLAQIADSGRFNAERVQAPVMSNKVVKSKARVIEQEQISTPEIKSVRSKKQDQTSMING